MYLIHTHAYAYADADAHAVQCPNHASTLFELQNWLLCRAICAKEQKIYLSQGQTSRPPSC